MLTFKGAIGDRGDNWTEAVRAIQRDPKAPGKSIKERMKNKGAVNLVTCCRDNVESEDRGKPN